MLLLTPVLSTPIRVRSAVFFIHTFLRHRGGSLKTLPENWGKNRLKKYKINSSRKTEDPVVQEVLQPFRTAFKKQEDNVRVLKESGASELDIKMAGNESRRKSLEAKELEFAPPETGFVQARMEDLLNKRFYIKQSFEIYGGVAGLCDFGNLGVKMQNNILAFWRSHFVKEDDMLEVSCSSLTPEKVLKTSGHVDQFADLMVKDLKNGKCFRVNHLIENHLKKMMKDENVTSEQCAEYEDIIAKLDGYSKKEVNTLLRKFNIKSPNTGNDLSDAEDFNLMLKSSMDPKGNSKGYLRPETAQGIFTNFKHLVNSDQCKLPFAVAQIGDCYRNEISPGPLRLKEFKIAEIEHFIDPRYKEHPKFDKVKDLKLILYSACNQKDGVPAVLTTIGDAVEKGVVANETLGYFMARIYQFLIAVGVNPEKLRFRQHMPNGMAHYATDCWDAETKLTSGWIECVGCADRSCYDLEKHMDTTGARLTARSTFKEPTVQVTELKPQMAVIRETYKRDSRGITKALKNLNEEEISNVEKELESKNEYKLSVNGKEFSITKDMIVISRGAKTIHVEEVIPFVIESSFGILRIMYSIWEHNFRMRIGNEMRRYFALPPVVAPYKCSILPLSDHPDFSPLVTILREKLKRGDVSHLVSNSRESIGRRYTISDEMAIPFGITIDFDSLKEPCSVTLRERDTMEQIRVPLDQTVPLIQDLTSGKRTWDSARSCYPKFEQQEAAKPG